MAVVLQVSEVTSGAAGVEYRRRRPELGELYRVVADNYRTLEAAADQNVIAPLPSFVKDEFASYLDCGVLGRGFGFLQCKNAACRQKLLAAFSCKGRGWCPACLGRAMAETAANWVEHVLPSCAPLRQWVLTLPFELRARIAYDRELCSRVTRLFADSVLGFYRRTMRDLHRVGAGQSGAITVVQRVNSDLRLNPHLHLLALDGVFVETDDGQLAFHQLPSLENSDVADLLHTARLRILAFLERRGIIEQGPEARLAEDGFAEREPELAALATAAVTGDPPAGPEHRQRPAIALPEHGERFVSGLSAREDGFSVHAATTAPADDARARETLCKYVLRPPLAQDRVRRLASGLVRIVLKRAFSDGTTAIDLDPLSLLCRLAASVPPPRAHRVHYAGVLAAAHRWRARVVPPLPPAVDDDCTGAEEHAHAGAHDAEHEEADAAARPATHRSRYRPWRELLMRAFKIDIEKCAKCGAPMLLRALVTAAETVTRFLRRLGEDPEPPPIAPPRRPPFFTSPALRRRLGEVDGNAGPQMEMFGG